MIWFLATAYLINSVAFALQSHKGIDEHASFIAGGPRKVLAVIVGVLHPLVGLAALVGAIRKSKEDA